MPLVPVKLKYTLCGTFLDLLGYEKITRQKQGKGGKMRFGLQSQPLEARQAWQSSGD